MKRHERVEHADDRFQAAMSEVAEAHLQEVNSLRLEIEKLCNGLSACQPGRTASIVDQSHSSPLADWEREVNWSLSADIRTSNVPNQQYVIPPELTIFPKPRQKPPYTEINHADNHEFEPLAEFCYPQTGTLRTRKLICLPGSCKPGSEHHHPKEPKLRTPRLGHTTQQKHCDQPKPHSPQHHTPRGGVDFELDHLPADTYVSKMGSHTAVSKEDSLLTVRTECNDDSNGERESVHQPYSLRSNWNLTEHQLRDRKKGGSPKRNGASAKKMLEKSEVKFFVRRTKGVFHKHWQLLHPESRKRIMWDACSIFFLAYDSAMIPLQAFHFGIEAFTGAADIVLTAFWTFDILASLLTGVYIKGEICREAAPVAKQYAQSWMCFDIALVTLEYVLLGMSVDSLSSVSGLRVLRILRFARLLRVAKIRSFANKLILRINNASVLLFMKMTTQLMLLLMLNHLVASIWYTLGESGNKSNSWLAAGSYENSSPLYCYVSSLHWALTQFHGSMEIVPTNEGERAFACAMIYFGLLITSSFVGNMTNAILTFHSFHAERTRRFNQLCSYLKDKGISRRLCAKSKRIFQERALMQKDKQAVDLSSMLTQDIITDLHEESRVPHTLSNTLMCSLCGDYPRLVRQLSHSAMEELQTDCCHDFFFKGDPCRQVLILTSGTLMYVRHGNHEVKRRTTVHSKGSGNFFANLEDLEAYTTIHDNRWIGELVLWTYWQCQGWLTSLNDCQLLSIDESRFYMVVSQHPDALVMAAEYAKKVIASLKMQFVDDLYGHNSSLRTQLADDLCGTQSIFRQHTAKHECC